MRGQDLLLALTLFFLIGCTTIEDCQNDRNRPYLIIRFSHSDVVSFDSIKVNDSYRLAGDTDTLLATGVFLDPELSTTMLSFFTDSIDYDLAVSYQSQVQIFEVDCPPSLYLSNLDTVSHSFDSLAIVQTTLTNTNLNGDITVFF